ncbi:MAG: DUF885 domain-containing protein [Microthrixaceae bacterium]
MNEHADPKGNSRVTDELTECATLYWRLVLESSPISATFYGVHDFDDRLDDLSVDVEADQRRDFDRVRSRAAALDPASLTIASRVTRSLLLDRLDTRIEGIDLGLVEMSSDHMDGPHAQLLMVAPLLTYPEPDHAEAALTRYAQVPRLLGQAIDRFRDGLSKGRTPAAAVLERSISSLDRYLESDITNDPFLGASVPEDWDGREAWRSELLDLVRNRIRPAFEVYRNVLRDDLMPSARPDEKAGWCWLPDGEALYQAQIRSHTSIAPVPAELHALGRSLTEVSLPEEYRAVAGRWFNALGDDRPQIGLDKMDGLFDFIRTAPQLRHQSSDEVILIAEATVTRAAAAMPEWFGRLPVAECMVSAVPEFMAADAPYAYYFPPAVDGTRPGTYFINASNPTESSRTEAESIAFHEAIPGHHLQIAISQELDGLPEFQRHEGSTAYVEGWGLYAERLAEEMGLYSDDPSLIGMLTADSWRSARLVVDTGLHALGWSRQQAIDYFEEFTPVPMEQAISEVDRYMAIPGQALSYKVGQIEIQRLRNHAEQSLGAKFDIRSFHDVVLGSGAVSLPVLEELVINWIETR